MSERSDTNFEYELVETAAEPLGSAGVGQASQPYVGRWNRLVSTTNWEKGRIIHQWRDALSDAGAPPTEFSDEAWSRLVGGVSGQHAGRLRRVYRRFGSAYDQYDGLYWSHFQAALDWDDAEMWLEGAVQSGWSVSQMRRQRWETLGAEPSQEPRAEEDAASDIDEDFEPALNEDPAAAPEATEYNDAYEGPRHEGPDFGDDLPETRAATGRRGDGEDPAGEDGASIYTQDNEATIDFVRPFENLAELPDDLADAFESFKLAILRHKADDWREISRDDLLGTLDALKELALAPAADSAPF